MPVSRYACIGLVSAAALLFQVAQTRLFSSSYGYHLTYLVISVSLLGVGSGATLSGVFDRRSQRPSLSSLALAAAASALAALFLFFANALGEHVPAAYLILFGALITAVMLSWGLLLLPLRKVMGAALVTAVGRRTTIQALAVGFGFIAAEIVLLQRLTLYLGQPALALAVGLAALLVGAAGGSAASAGGRVGVARAALASAIVVTVAFLAFDRVAAATLSWPLLARGATACLVSIGIGLPLGSVFPSVIASAGAYDRSEERRVGKEWRCRGGV